MKVRQDISRLASALLLTTMLAACASSAERLAGDTAQQALYRSHAGAPVTSFRFLGRIYSWTPLGSSAVAVWTRTNEAWLLDLTGPCNGLEYTPVIGLTSTGSTVSARFDKVLVRDNAPVNMPCTIAEIRPIDVPALKAAERAERAAKAQASGT